MATQIRSLHPLLVHYSKIMNATSSPLSNDLDIILGICYSTAWVSGVSCVLYLTYKFIREYTYVTVNCWFCNGNIKVPFKQREEWFCTLCEQFNGFNKEGDYIRPIPEQYDEHLNTRNSNIVLGKQSKISSQNGLCRTCNANQELKIRQIASYVPLRESDYDKEIELFKQKLEKSYNLCSVCERTVQSTIKLKSSLYAAKISRQKENYLTNVASTRQSTKNRWIYTLSGLCFAIFLTPVWSYRQRFAHVYSMYNLFDDHFTNTDYSWLINISTVILAACLSRSTIGKCTALITFLTGILVFSIDGAVFSVIKVIFCFMVSLFFIFKFINKNISSESLKKPSKEKKCISESKITFNETDNTSTPVTFSFNNPLCGTFSNLSLGRTQVVSSHGPNSSYLFKSRKVFLKPSKLVVDDWNLSSESTLSSPTISSGYESVDSFNKKPYDSVSEFDSVSQISNYYGTTNFHNSMSNDLVRRRSNPLYCNNLGKYYGVSSVRSSPGQSFSKFNTSDVQVNALFSALQIIACSLAFFILGFFLQLLISRMKF